MPPTLGAMQPDRSAFGHRKSIAAALAEADHLNERGQPFNPKSIVAMVAQKT